MIYFLETFEKLHDVAHSTGPLHSLLSESVAHTNFFHSYVRQTLSPREILSDFWV